MTIATILLVVIALLQAADAYLTAHIMKIAAYDITTGWPE